MIMISKQTSSSIIVIALALVYAANPSVANHEQINKLQQGRSSTTQQSTVKWQSRPDLATTPKGTMPPKNVSKHRDLVQVKSTKSNKASSSLSKSGASKSTKTLKSCKSGKSSSSKGSNSAIGKSAGGTTKSSKSAITLPCSESSSPISTSPTLSPTTTEKDVRTETPSTSPSVSQSEKSPTESPSQGPSASPSQQQDIATASSMSPSGSPNEASLTSSPVSQAPSSGPSAMPSHMISLAPSVSPSLEEEFVPSATPSDSASPSTLPSISPSEAPSTDEGERETTLPSQEPSSSLSVSMAPSTQSSVDEDDDTQVLSDPPSASPSLTDSPSQEPSTSTSMPLDAIEVCRCNQDNVCIGGKLTQSMEFLRLCFFASDEQTIASVNNLKLDQPSLYSADILVDDAEISDQVERTCDDSRQTCVVMTPVDAEFFDSDVPPPLMAQGTAVSTRTLPNESRNLRGSRRVEQVVMTFNVVVELEKMTTRAFEEMMGIPINGDADRIRGKPWWVIGVCFFCLNIGVVVLVTYWETIKKKRRERQLVRSEGPPEL